jgi:hypothetical protein
VRQRYTSLAAREGPAGDPTAGILFVPFRLILHEAGIKRRTLKRVCYTQSIPGWRNNYVAWRFFFPFI